MGANFTNKMVDLIEFPIGLAASFGIGALVGVAEGSELELESALKNAVMVFPLMSFYFSSALANSEIKPIVRSYTFAKNPDPYINLGSIFMKSDTPSQAVPYFEKFLELDRNYPKDNRARMTQWIEKHRKK